IDTLMEELKDKDKYLDKEVDISVVEEDLELFKEVYIRSRKIKNIFDSIASKAGKFANVEKELESKFSYIYDITDELSLIALNSSVESYKLGSTGASFFVVSSEIKKDSERIGKLVVGLKNDIQELLKIVRSILLYTNISKLSIYMIIHFIDEILNDGDEGNLCDCEMILRDMVSVESNDIEITSKFITELLTYLKKTNIYINDVENIIGELHYIQLNGLVESARLGEQKFSIIFNQVKELVENTTNIINEIKPMIINTIKEAEDISNISEKIFKELRFMQDLIKEDKQEISVNS
ncbi:Methyl-accepting chemotaxis-like protein (chemotaxis sensory transducer), partial [Hydrogenivirga sp. 128-5-R1-1]|uniref:Methyl-accepting chemotaxis-like protein (chemotaxis sensory transducer) n=1 Tax=Hydrogenivirga sp. 128-5-R1-1 TaxID=392423 RepID=UPI00015F151C